MLKNEYLDNFSGVSFNFWIIFCYARETPTEKFEKRANQTTI